MKKILTQTKAFAIIALGLIIYTFGWSAFLIPAGINGGGVSGIAALIFYATGFPVAYSYFIINVGLILIAIKILGPSFGVKTIFAVLVASLMFSIWPKVITEPIVEEKFMSAILGAILGGAGVGIAFSQGGSTGGTDIPAMIINKYRNISPGQIILYFDIVIISSTWFIFKDVGFLVYGYVSMAIIAYTIDMVINGSKQSVQLFIISKEYEKIAANISCKVGRGITILDGHGFHSQKPRKVLMVMARKYESAQLYRVIKEADPNAFISVANVMGVYGSGFDHLKVK